MIDYVMSTSCEGVLMEILEVRMQQGVATSSTTIGAHCNLDLLWQRDVQLSLYRLKIGVCEKRYNMDIVGKKMKFFFAIFKRKNGCIANMRFIE